MKARNFGILAMSVLAVSALASCGGGGNSKIDKTKTQITVKTFDGGFGVNWIRESAKKYEALVADKSFEEGKKGVQILVDGDKGITGSSLAGAKLDADIYFTEMVDVVNFVKTEKLLDISDIVKGSYDSIFEESGNIEDKLADEYKSYLTQVDGKYYALPFYDGVWSIICDVDYFLKNGWMFYESGNIGCGNADLVEDPHLISKGLDGEWGTFDDGLPVSFAQWNTLCEAMIADGVIPFANYGGGQENYSDQAIKNVWATVEGSEDFKKQVHFDGTIDVIDVDNWNGTGAYPTKNVTFDKNNMYMAQRSAGKYEAFRFMDEIITGTGHYDKAPGNYTQMQQLFIMSPIQETEEAKRYGMVIDGSWWTNEASDVFTRIEQQGGKGAKERRFVFMPLPTPSGEHQKSVYISQNESFGFINKNANNVAASKSFFQYLHTTKAMCDFTLATGTTRALSYQMPDWEVGKDISYFTASVIAMKNGSAHYEIVYPYTDNEIVRQNTQVFDYRSKWPFMASINGSETSQPFVEIASGQVTGYQYFKGHYNYYNEAWNNNLAGVRS